MNDYKLYTVALVFALIIVMAGMFTIALQTPPSNYIPQMSVACEHKLAGCQSLINKVQAGNYYEVLTDTQGHYWAEAK